MSTEDIWEKFLTKIKSKVSLMSFNYIFKDLRLHSYKNSKIIIIVPNNELLLQNITKNYESIIEDILNDITNDTCEIKYVFDSDVKSINIDDNKDTTNSKQVDENPLEKDLRNYNYSSNFNPKYTFETFVVGEANKLAYGTALSVAQNPGKLYNPYFIFASSGLGKTHLMHAIGNYIVTHSDKKVLYVKADQFLNDYLSIINSNNNNIEYLEAFRNKYRNVDVLMIDDIQNLDNKAKTQLEFTNTFNELHDNGKQIIIASDKSLNDYKFIEERLKTRFKWGLTEYINPPEFELKRNIIKNKLIVNNFDFDLKDEIIDYIANNCGSDIRNLEGAVTRIAAYKSIFNLEEINLNDAADALKEFVDVPVYRTNSISKIIDVVAKYYGLDSTMIKGKMKKKNIADARAIVMYLSRILTKESLERIGLEIGGRDHSTVIYSYEKISNELKDNLKLQEEIRILKDKLRE